jgi:magnesium transporter
MNPDFVSVPAQATVVQALERVQASDLPPQHVSTVCVVDDQGKLVGALSLAELIRADGSRRVSSITDSTLPTFAPETELPEVARVMSDYNMTAIPVVEDEGEVVGLIAVDDVLEQLIPEEWRWRAGAARE